jgi:hypothetical protein
MLGLIVYLAFAYILPLTQTKQARDVEVAGNMTLLKAAMMMISEVCGLQTLVVRPVGWGGLGQ